MFGRRKFLLSTTAIGTAAIAGCAELSSSSTLSWEEAFQQHLTDDDASVLAPTPVVVDAVTSESEVKTALAVLGLTTSGTDVSTDTLTQMDEFATTAAEIQEYISPVLTRVTSVTDLIDEMKNTSAFGVSVWDALVSAKPPLEGFDIVLQETQTQLNSISNKLEEIETAIGGIGTRIEEIQSQQTTEYSSLPQTIESAISITNTLIADIQDVIEPLENIEELASEATDAADDLPDMNQQVSTVFGSLNTEAENVRIEFEGVQSEIETLQGAVTDFQSNAANRANQRYEPISNDATGSTEQMTLAEIDTSVEAYQLN